MKIHCISGFSSMDLFNKLNPQTLRENGYEVVVLNWNTIYSFIQIFPIPNILFVYKIKNELILKIIKDVSPDFILILKGEHCNTETLSEIKKKSLSKLINCFDDYPWELPTFSKKICFYYNYFFTNNTYSVQFYHQAGDKNAFHLSFGYPYELVVQCQTSQRI